MVTAFSKLDVHVIELDSRLIASSQFSKHVLVLPINPLIVDQLKPCQPYFDDCFL